MFTDVEVAPQSIATAGGVYSKLESPDPWAEDQQYNPFRLTIL